ncbi:MAG: branched-chain amino acid ABC transporter permease [Rhodovulum sulfidophilum]|uniref:Branched-chain amino acid ABC transporter permease n=1 Tax=Rhodovulum sulfidophilum TaxID=35806 RepID=A0A2W5N228_RHOSU|nr:MAG: branched-chain amino acid ABC transporter permease [Rhodovulum sulfidophilum]
MAYFLEQFSNGLAIGGIYALIALGYSLVYSILNLINFAHGYVIMVGAFVALQLIAFGVDPALAVFLACCSGALIAMLVERIAYRPVRHANRVIPMISALGAGLVLSSFAQLVWGPEVRAFPQLIPRFPVEIGGVTLSSQSLVILGISIALVVASSWFLHRTRFGLAAQCVRQDMAAAQLMGIPVNTVIVAIYALGGFLGVAGSVLFAMYFNAVFIQMGLLATTKAWAAAMLGGIGSFQGAFWGGILLGLAETAAVVFAGAAYRDGVSMAIIVLVLLLRPAGLFGKSVGERS